MIKDGKNLWQEYLEQTGEYGTVEEIRQTLVRMRGLPGARPGEAVMFADGSRGQVTALREDTVEAAVLSRARLVPGTKVVRTGERLSVRCHNSLRSKAIDPLGRSLFTGEELAVTGGEIREIDIQPPHMGMRKNIVHPFVTGTSVIDLLLTIGRGQREVVLGNPTTGKNSLLLSTIRSQAETGMVIYAVIGKPWNDIKRVYNFIDQYTNKQNVVLVGTSADTVPGLTVLAPFVAMTLAEYWRDKGEDAVVILDDMTTHAAHYREMALLARRFPARESYPGDIFHLHARLLERAGNFKVPGKEASASITCLPVAETSQGEITGYIASNLMSITDGHLIFDEAVFAQGRRPAVDISLSVTRVGSHTRTPLLKQLHRALTALLAEHDNAQKFTHFGAELPEDVRERMESGARLLEFFSQPLFLVVPFPVQVVMASMIRLGWLNDQEGRIASWREGLTRAWQKDAAAEALINNLLKEKDLDAFDDHLNKERDNLLELCQKIPII